MPCSSPTAPSLITDPTITWNQHPNVGCLWPPWRQTVVTVDAVIALALLSLPCSCSTHLIDFVYHKLSGQPWEFSNPKATTQTKCKKAGVDNQACDGVYSNPCLNSLLTPLEEDQWKNIYFSILLWHVTLFPHCIV